MFCHKLRTLRIVCQFYNMGLLRTQKQKQDVIVRPFIGMQFDQIWRNFVILAKSFKSWAIIWGFINYLGNYWKHFGKFCMLLGQVFIVLNGKMLKIKQAIWPHCWVVSFYFYYRSERDKRLGWEFLEGKRSTKMLGRKRERQKVGYKCD